jgi:hypothetical protein
MPEIGDVPVARWCTGWILLCHTKGPGRLAGLSVHPFLNLGRKAATAVSQKAQYETDFECFIVYSRRLMERRADYSVKLAPASASAPARILAITVRLNQAIHHRKLYSD